MSRLEIDRERGRERKREGERGREREREMEREGVNTVYLKIGLIQRK